MPDYARLPQFQRETLQTGNSMLEHIFGVQGQGYGSPTPPIKESLWLAPVTRSKWLAWRVVHGPSKSLCSIRDARHPCLPDVIHKSGVAEFENEAVLLFNPEVPSLNHNPRQNPPPPRTPCSNH